jgi:GH3 auxin-responsive promoter
LPNGIPPAVANSLWYASCLREAYRFGRALGDVAGTQERLLLEALRRNEGTEYGRRHGFAKIRSTDEYRERVPLTDYEDYAEAVGRISAGESNVLTGDPVLLLEPTSGSTAATKLVPYTAALRSQFGRAIAPWIVDLFRDRRLLRGTAYWSASPVARREERTPGGIPIGFEDDAGYLGSFGGALARSVLAVPAEVARIEDMESFRYAALLFVLRSRSLALISVWNPTFLALLVGRLSGWWPDLADDIARGTISSPGPLPPGISESLAARNRPDPRRAAEVRAAFRAGGDPGAVHSRLWPRLRLVSCWTEAHAALHAPGVARLFPRACVQGKGLLATECAVSFPLRGLPGAALATRSHFFEFLPEGETSATTRLAHELEPGGRYSVIVTTGGGLYRYRLHDLVEVAGHLGGCPLLRFLGRQDLVSDFFGEKLNERHVREVLRELLPRYAPHAAFAMVAFEPGETPENGAYTLFVEANDAPDAALRALGEGLEHSLRRNYHYRYCRELGQLNALRVFRTRAGAPEAYHAACRSRGQKAGHIKPVALHRLGGWSRHFPGGFLA